MEIGAVFPETVVNDPGYNLEATIERVGIMQESSTITKMSMKWEWDKLWRTIEQCPARIHANCYCDYHLRTENELLSYS